jgi:hypothetical protein
MAGDKPVIWVGCEADYFFSDGWTGQIKLKWFEKLACARRRQNSFGSRHEPTDRANARRMTGSAICGIQRKYWNPGFCFGFSNLAAIS